MSFRYLWLEPHRRVLEIGPQEDGTYLYFIDTFLLCKETLSIPTEAELKVQGGISIAEVELQSDEHMETKAELLIDEEYRIAQIISIELRVKEKISEEKLKDEAKKAEEKLQGFCSSD